jgi:hypothetical protein
MYPPFEERVKAVEHEAYQPTESCEVWDTFSDKIQDYQTWLEKVVFFAVAGNYCIGRLKLKYMV